MSQRTSSIKRKPVPDYDEAKILSSGPSPPLSCADTVSKESIPSSEISDLSSSKLYPRRNPVPSYDEYESNNGVTARTPKPYSHEKNFEFAERAGPTKVYLVHETSHGPDPRWFVGWEVGPERKENDKHTRMRVLEILNQGLRYSNFGAVSKPWELDPKSSICIGKLDFATRGKLEAIALATPVKRMDPGVTWSRKDWVKDMLYEAVQQGVVPYETVDEAIKHAEEELSSHPLRRESRRLGYVHTRLTRKTNKN